MQKYSRKNDLFYKEDSVAKIELYEQLSEINCTSINMSEGYSIDIEEFSNFLNFVIFE